MKSTFLTLLTLVCVSLCSTAQIQTQYAQHALLGERGVFGVPQRGVLQQLPKIDVSVLLQEDSLEANMSVPFRFGQAMEVDYTLENTGTWSDIPGGRVWKLDVHSQGAYSINFIFDGLALPDGGKLYLYNQERTMVYGPITRDNRGESSQFGTDLIKGEMVTLELFEPKTAYNTTQLRIVKAIHGYKNMFNTPNNFGDALGCHNNVNCPAFAGWQPQSNSVAMVLLADGTRVCSGALLNNTCQDLTPNFLTAFHCIDVGDNLDPCEAEWGNGTLNANEINRAQNWVFRFQYKSPTCTPSTEPTSWITFNGATFRAGWLDTDFALVEMNTRPDASTGIQYAGWSRNVTAPTSGANIHHPRGDVMKISTFNNPAVNSMGITWDIGCGRFNFTPANTHWTLTLTNGTTEGGSSGSPLFDQNQRIVGQLHGGANGCAPIIKHYGKLDRSWNGDGTAQTRLHDWLDPSNTGAMTTNTIPIAGITGPTTLCTSDTYTLTNLPAGVTVTGWSASPSGAVTLSGSGNSRTVTKVGNFNGGVKLTATISTSCGNIEITRTVHVGATPVLVRGPFDQVTHAIVTPCAFQTYNFQAGGLIGFPPDPGATYSWTLTYPPGLGLLPTSYSGQTVTISFNGPGNYSLTVTKTSACGVVEQTVNYNVPSCFGGFSVYPNPANETLTVSMGSEAERAAVPDKSSLPSFSAVLYDTQGRQIRQGESKDGAVLFDTRQLPEGTYFLHIHHDGQVEKRQVVIRH